MVDQPHGGAPPPRKRERRPAATSTAHLESSNQQLHNNTTGSLIQRGKSWTDEEMRQFVQLLGRAMAIAPGGWLWHRIADDARNIGEHLLKLVLYDRREPSPEEAAAVHDTHQHAFFAEYQAWCGQRAVAAARTRARRKAQAGQ